MSIVQNSRDKQVQDHQFSKISLAKEGNQGSTYNMHTFSSSLDTWLRSELSSGDSLFLVNKQLLAEFKSTWLRFYISILIQTRNRDGNEDFSRILGQEFFGRNEEWTSPTYNQDKWRSLKLYNQMSKSYFILNVGEIKIQIIQF